MLVCGALIPLGYALVRLTCTHVNAELMALVFIPGPWVGRRGGAVSVPVGFQTTSYDKPLTIMQQLYWCHSLTPCLLSPVYVTCHAWLCLSMGIFNPPA